LQPLKPKAYLWTSSKAGMTRFSSTLLSLALITPLGFYTKIYQGPGAPWVHEHLGGVLYVVFWCLVLVLVFRKTQPWKIAPGVLLVTCGLEFLQLWHPLFLEYLRSYYIGRTILGTTFDWYDFPYYFAGWIIGWLWLKWLPGPNPVNSQGTAYL
jgi:hypothetical protein